MDLNSYLDSARRAVDAARLASIELGLDEEKMVELLSGTLRECGVEVPGGLSLKEALGYLDALPDVDEGFRISSDFERMWINTPIDPASVFEIPRGIKRIGKYAFSQFNAGKIIVPDGVEEICDGAFYMNARTGFIELPDSVKTIGASAFYSLGNEAAWRWGNDVNIPSAVEFIGDQAFAYIRPSHSFIHTIPKTCSYIGKYAFIKNPSYYKNQLTFAGRTLEEVRAMENYPFGCGGGFTFIGTDGSEVPSGV